MPLQATSGAASYDGFGGGVPAVPNYIEDVFSTYLYTGTGASQTITNGIDLSTKGGLVWLKKRSAVGNHFLVDTIRGGLKPLYSNSTNAQPVTNQSIVTSFNTNGFTLGNEDINDSAATYASWTFRKQPKFFDVVTTTSSSLGEINIAHALGSSPGAAFIKRVDGTGDWTVWHRSADQSKYLLLNSTAAETAMSGGVWASASSASFYAYGVGPYFAANAQYVVYLFAHNAGGFGLSGTDNVISCGGFTTDGSASGSVTLGYEPQFVLMKCASSPGGNWFIFDTMRGIYNLNDFSLYANSSSAEQNSSGYNLIDINATGFTMQIGNAGTNWIYIAIRKGPMKVPTSGTTVFDVDTYTGDNATSRLISSGFAADTALITDRTDASYGQRFISDRLRGGGNSMATESTAAENGDTGYYNSDMLNEFQSNSGILVTPKFSRYNASSKSNIAYQFKRAPSFHDVVCWTATGSPQTISHNLGAIPEMMIRKRRDSSTSGQWDVYVAPLGASKKLQLESTAAQDTNLNTWTNTTPTSSVMYMGNTGSGWTYVTYLFATCAGVSKVGSYTGNGSSQTINCGFTGGARFILIKNTTSGGTDWQVFDSARGITSGNDPVLYLNSTSAELNYNFISPNSTGFTLNDGDSQYNASGSTYIYLAIA